MSVVTLNEVPSTTFAYPLESSGTGRKVVRVSGLVKPLVLLGSSDIFRLRVPSLLFTKLGLLLTSLKTSTRYVGRDLNFRHEVNGKNTLDHIFIGVGKK